MKFAIGYLDWPKIESWCSDFDCPCGTSTHHCTDRKGSAQYFRCSGCGQVYAFEEQVRLLISEVMPDNQTHNPESLWATGQLMAYVQWKGSFVYMSVACFCGKQFQVERDFAYEADCPHCQQRYIVDWYVGVRKPELEEIARAAVIHCDEDEAADDD